MARPQKEGLEYFPVVTAFDEKIELIIAEFGPEGLGIIIGLFQRIYSNGYYISWNNDTLMLFATKHINTDKARIEVVLARCIERNIFDKELFQRYGILTSRGIQKQYLKVCKDCKRKSIRFIKEYCLVTDSELMGIISEFVVITPEETPIIPEETPVNSGESTQRKEKKRKVKKIKLKRALQNNSGGNSSLNALSLELINYYSTLRPGESIAAHMDFLKICIDKYGYEWTKDALQICISKKGKFIVAWIEKVLINWKSEGKEDTNGPDNGDSKQDNSGEKGDEVRYDFSKYGG